MEDTYPPPEVHVKLETTHDAPAQGAISGIGMMSGTADNDGGEDWYDAPVAQHGDPGPSTLASQAIASSNTAGASSGGPPIRLTRQTASRSGNTVASSKKARPRHIKLFSKSAQNGKVLPLPFGEYTRDMDAVEDLSEPIIFEEQFILRVPPLVLQGDASKGLKGLDEIVKAKKEIEGISIKFKDKRKAVFQHGDTIYGARLVDLPTIIEGHKTMDRKRTFKVAEISQMLVVEHPIESEASLLDENANGKASHDWPHGITPPLAWVRKRRWRKRQNNKREKQIQDEVERLLALDEAADQYHLSMVDAQVVAPRPAPAAETPQLDEDDQDSDSSGSASSRSSRPRRAVGEGADNEVEEEDDEVDGRSAFGGTEVSGNDFENDLAALLDGFKGREGDAAGQDNPEDEEEDEGSEPDEEDDEEEDEEDDDEEELADEGDDEINQLRQQLRAYEQEVRDFEAVVEAATERYNTASRLLKSKLQRAQQDLRARKEHVEATQAQIDHKLAARGLSASRAQAAQAGNADQEDQNAVETRPVDEEEDEEDDDLFGENDGDEEIDMATPAETPAGELQRPGFGESSGPSPMEVDPETPGAPRGDDLTGPSGSQTPAGTPGGPVSHPMTFPIDEEDDSDED